MTPMTPVRLLVVDDSRVQREMLIAAFSRDPQISVVGWASGGVEAVALAQRLNPDVISMDLRMPHMDGLEASAAILALRAVPIVMVTDSPSRFDQQLVARALELGILAVTHKPALDAPGEVQRLCTLVRQMAGVRLFDRRTGAGGRSAPRRAAPVLRSLGRVGLEGLDLGRVRVVGICASTGGPQVLEALLRPLPAHFPLPILVVQHIAAGFAPSLIDWLAPLCALPVRLAERGRPLERGVWFAHEGHLVVQGAHHGQGAHLGQSLEPALGGHRPSGTLLFRSLARELGRSALGLQLTGMGEDGAEGLRELREAGGQAVAQSEDSAALPSMPRAAIRHGVDAVLTPPELGDLLRALSSGAGVR